MFSSSVNDNDELLARARMLLVRMCGVTPPRPLIGPILNSIFDTILNSPVRRSWLTFEDCAYFIYSRGRSEYRLCPWFKVRTDEFTVQAKIHFSLVFYFRQVPLLTDARITEILEVGRTSTCFQTVTETCQMVCKCLDDEVVEVREMAAT